MGQLCSYWRHFKVTEYLGVLILPKIFLLVSMKALDKFYYLTEFEQKNFVENSQSYQFNKIHFAAVRKTLKM
jgi:hypothetical protein